MSDILQKFNVFSKISEEFKQSIKLFHVFNDFNGKNVLFVTNDDKVFAFGFNNDGKCGFGNHETVEIPQEIPELNGKQIKQFFIGYDFVLALNENNHVFGWGRNYYGQLGRGYTNDIEKPAVIPDLENIIEISCGKWHSLALDEQGNVFSWGYNGRGQVGCGKESGEYISRPVQLKSLPKIKSIHCYKNISFAVTFDGLVYSWGQNRDYCLGHKSRDDEIYKPELICGLNNVISVGSSKDNTYFLTNEGNIYFFGEIASPEDSDSDSHEYQLISKILETDLKFQSIQTIYYYSNDSYSSKVLALSEETVYCLERNTIQKTKYKTFFDYYLNENQITFKTIMNSINRKINYLYKQFEEKADLGSGAFGRVVKVMSKTDKKVFAIKIIEIRSKDLNKINKIETEVKVLSKCSEEYVVKYYNSWTENNMFYIKMELFDDNLENTIEEKKICFNRRSLEAMTTTEYFISSHLLKELLECVQYLHELKPEIIHRDLKPQNILINYEHRNGRFLKLADFGLATFGSEQTISHSMWTGTRNYIAPEVMSGTDRRSRYSSKADVYSLGQIICDLFDFDFNSSDQSIRSNEELKEEWDQLDDLFEQMSHRKYQKRPTCAQILEKSSSWLIDRNQVKLDLVSNSKFFDNFLLSKTQMNLY